jgi:FMN phosphatase YigB (HAD superfamily)
MRGLSTSDLHLERFKLPDRRFGPIDEAVGSPRSRVLSVDVFDTLLWRRVPKPTDIHLLVGRRLHDRGALANHIDASGYSRLRILAEEEARRRKQEEQGTPEVTLAEIHTVLAAGIASSLGIEGTAAEELEVEGEVTFADGRLVTYLEARLSITPTLRLIAVSDTYLSADQMGAIFARHGLDRLPFARIFTSSDHGTGKAGGLWKRVIDDLGIEPDQLVHLGDNLEADVTSALRVGARAVFYPMNTPRYDPVASRERILGYPGDPSPWVDGRYGDGGLTALRRRATFLEPPRPLTGHNQVAWETGTAVLGPVFTGYAQWVRSTAAELGSERIVCLMREGLFLKSLIDRAAASDDHRLHTATAWVSREACARAGVYEGSEAELRSFLDRLRAPSPARIMESWGLDAADLPELDGLMERFTSGGRGREAGDALVDLVLARPTLVEKVVNRSARARHLLVDHFVAAAGPGEGPVVVVDIGWSGSIQEALMAMLRSAGSELALHGLYLLAHIGAADRALRGVVIEGFLGSVGTNPFDVSSITGGPEIIELVSTCAAGSLLELSDHGVPVLAPVSAGPEEEVMRGLVQAGVAAYQAEWLDGASQRSEFPETFETTPTGRTMLRRVLGRFVSLPNLDEAAAFSWWEHEENFGSEGSDRLVPEHYLDTLRHRTAENLHWSPMSELYWVGGAAALVDNETADSILLMREATAEPGRFSTTSEAGQLRITLRGAGGIHERSSTLVPIAINRHGLSLVEWTGDSADVGQVVVMPTQLPALVRIDRFDVVTTDVDGAVLFEFRWMQGDDHDALPTSGARWPAVGVLAAGGDRSIVVDLPTVDSGPGGTLTVTLAGAFLSVPPGAGPTGMAAEAELANVRKELDAVYASRTFRSSAVPRRAHRALRRWLGARKD